MYLTNSFSFFYQQIVGMDSHSIVGADSELYYTTQFIKALIKHPWLNQAYILFVGEKNSGHDSGQQWTDSGQ